MKKFILATDSSCDCKKEELIEKDVRLIYFKYFANEEIFVNDMDESKFKDFYEDMRKGKSFKTSQINVDEYIEFFEQLLKENQNIIYVSLGLGLSNTCNSAIEAANILKEKYPNSNIYCVDSKIACLGVTLIVNKGIEYRDNGDDVEIAYKKLVNDVNYCNTFYTTDTLTYFARGGRLSKAKAIVGNAFRINPILDCTQDGKLRVVKQVRGEKHAINYIKERVIDSVLDAKDQYIYVCHADNEEKANLVGQKLVDEVGFKGYKTYFMGPTIGAHTGPGLVAVFYYGKERK